MLCTPETKAANISLSNQTQQVRVSSSENVRTYLYWVSFGPFFYPIKKIAPSNHTGPFPWPVASLLYPAKLSLRHLALLQLGEQRLGQTPALLSRDATERSADWWALELDVTAWRLLAADHS